MENLNSFCACYCEIIAERLFAILNVENLTNAFTRWVFLRIVVLDGLMHLNVASTHRCNLQLFEIKY